MDVELWLKTHGFNMDADSSSFFEHFNEHINEHINGASTSTANLSAAD